MEADARAIWSHALTEALECPIAIDFGRSRSAPIQARHERIDGRDGLRVRMHGAVFATAPDEVRDAVAKWLRSGRRARRAGKVLDTWIAERMADLPAARAKSSTLRPTGQCHDLAPMAVKLIAIEFAGDFDGDRRAPGITWGTRRRSRSRHSLRLGSYDVETNVVRLHPVLDQPAVPAWFVRFVLMHEILHAAMPPQADANGRWVHHSPEFRARERCFPDYARVHEWEKKNLGRLIASARRGTAMRTKPSPIERWVQGELYF
ncbi:MAG: hypothetical protein GY711_32170 [bacterium]|nr:hypothetical protein [bacterium]